MQKLAYYKICSLVLGSGIRFVPDGVRINLDSAIGTITNDFEFRALAGDDVFFWISGGGTVVVRNRYLPLVQRPVTAGVNPGKFSLFTGRADNEVEWVEPRRLARELFEELLLFYDERPVRPAILDPDDVIQSAWQRAMRNAPRISDMPPLDVPFVSIPLPARRMEISAGGKELTCWLPFHVNSRGDINLLFAYAVDLDPKYLTARDCECSVGHQSLSFQNRTVFLYDCMTGRARPISEPGAEIPLDASEMTEHLVAFLEMLDLAPRSTACG